MKTAFFDTSTKFKDSCNRNVWSLYRRREGNILNAVFSLNLESPFTLKNQQAFATRPINTVRYGSNSLSHLGPKDMDPSGSR